MSSFSVETDPDSPPWESTARSRRLKIGWRGRPVTAVSQGEYRSYLYPVFTPAGVGVTDESPIDHPHHQSVSIGTDHVNCRLPLPEPYAHRAEKATYNFWSNETYSGRAPGRIVGVDVESQELAADHLRLVQTLEWRSPAQWGSPDGVVVVLETRTIDVYPGEMSNVIDVRSQLRPTQWDTRIGPAMHAYFTVRMADGLRVADGGTLIDSEGRNGAARIRGRRAGWVDCSGMAAHGRNAGVAVLPYPSTGNPPWHLNDWGTVYLNPFLLEGRDLPRGGELDMAVRLIVHDGDAEEAGVANMFDTFSRQEP